MNTLSDALEFDHVIEVLPDGSWRDGPRDLWAPEAFEPDVRATELDGWHLPLSGFTGQYGYNGPWLHDSELIAGGVERYILAHPGYWVAIYASYADGGTEGWTVAFKPSR